MTETVREINNVLGKSWWDSLSPNMQLKYSLEQRAARHLFELSNRRAPMEILQTGCVVDRK